MTERTPPDSWFALMRDPDPWNPPSPLPGPTVTERLVVRRYVPSDAAALFEAVDASREALQPWMLWAQTDHQVVSDSAYYIERVNRASERGGCTDFAMGIFDRADGRYLGGTGFHRIDSGSRTAEIGYWVGHPHWGRGYATEATAGLITAGLEPTSEGGWGFRRIVLFCAADNPGSRQVMVKLGLRLEQRTRADRYRGATGGRPVSGYVDSYGYAVLADEWDPVAQRALPGIGWDD